MNLSTQLRSWPMRKSIILIWHCLGIFVTYYLAFLLRFDEELPDYVELFFISYPILMVCSVICFFLLQQFTGIWKYYSINDLFKTIAACVMTMIIFTLIIKKDLLGLNLEMSRMVLGIEFILLTGWSTASRAGVRFIRERRRKRILQSNEYKQNVLICGALDEADLFIRACSQDFQGLFCGIISDDLISHKRYIHGVQVYPKKLEDIGYIVKTYDITNIHILSPFNKPVETNTIIDSCAKAGVSPHFHTLPALGELAMGDISVSMIRKVDVSDLLG
jgi:FlaA1/EpsC-like NDP-sugar epimerase